VGWVWWADMRATCSYHLIMEGADLAFMSPASTHPPTLQNHTTPPPSALCREPTNGAAVIAERLEQLAAGRCPAQPAAPLSRLRDTIVFGYLMQTPKHTRVEVPEWYINGLEPSRRLVRSLQS
jgi:hypothetical protein